MPPNATFHGPKIVAVAFITLMGAFGLNLSGDQASLAGDWPWSVRQWR